MSEVAVTDVVTSHEEHEQDGPETLRNHPESEWPASWPLWLRDVFYLQLFRLSWESPGHRELLAALRMTSEGGGLLQIGIGSTPNRDSMLAENTAALESAFARPLVGSSGPVNVSCTVQNGIGGTDGWLSADGPLNFVRVSADGGDFSWCPVNVPLEIGSTSPKTTHAHLSEYGAVARWPYGHDRITVIAIDPRRRHPNRGALLEQVLGKDFMRGLISAYGAPTKDRP